MYLINLSNCYWLFRPPPLWGKERNIEQVKPNHYSLGRLLYTNSLSSCYIKVNTAYINIICTFPSLGWEGGDGRFSRKQFLQKETINLIFNRWTKEQGSEEEIAQKMGMGHRREFSSQYLLLHGISIRLFHGDSGDIFKQDFDVFSCYSWK